MLLVQNSKLVNMIIMKLVRKTNAPSGVARARLLVRSPRLPPTMVMSKPAPSEMNMLARKDLMIRSVHVKRALATSTAFTNRRVSGGMWESICEARFGGARAWCSRSSKLDAGRADGMMTNSKERLLIFR
jgi:hypothetical protein